MISLISDICKSHRAKWTVQIKMYQRRISLIASCGPLRFSPWRKDYLRFWWAWFWPPTPLRYHYFAFIFRDFMKAVIHIYNTASTWRYGTCTLMSRRRWWLLPLAFLRDCRIFLKLRTLLLSFYFLWRHFKILEALASLPLFSVCIEIFIIDYIFASAAIIFGAIRRFSRRITLSVRVLLAFPLYLFVFEHFLLFHYDDYGYHASLALLAKLHKRAKMPGIFHKRCRADLYTF